MFLCIKCFTTSLLHRDEDDAPFEWLNSERYGGVASRLGGIRRNHLMNTVSYREKWIKRMLRGENEVAVVLMVRVNG